MFCFFRLSYNVFTYIIIIDMEKEEIVILKHMSNTLERMLEIMSKPQSVIARAFDIGAAIVTILGILTIFDLITSWIGG